VSNNTYQQLELYKNSYGLVPIYGHLSADLIVDQLRLRRITLVITFVQYLGLSAVLIL